MHTTTESLKSPEHQHATTFPTCHCRTRRWTIEELRAIAAEAIREDGEEPTEESIDRLVQRKAGGREELAALSGIFYDPRRRPVTIEEMNESIAQCAVASGLGL